MLMCTASLIMTAEKWKQVRFPTIVNLLNRIYYNNIKNNHAVVKKVVKEYLWHEKERA